MCSKEKGSDPSGSCSSVGMAGKVLGPPGPSQVSHGAGGDSSQLQVCTHPSHSTTQTIIYRKRQSSPLLLLLGLNDKRNRVRFPQVHFLISKMLCFILSLHNACTGAQLWHPSRDGFGLACSCCCSANTNLLLVCFTNKTGSCTKTMSESQILTGMQLCKP